MKTKITVQTTVEKILTTSDLLEIAHNQGWVPEGWEYFSIKVNKMEGGSDCTVVTLSNLEHLDELPDQGNR